MQTLSIAAMVLLLSSQFAGASCGKPIGSTAWTDGTVVGFKTRIFNVDADGAPNSYRVDGKGLSFTCDGVVAVVGGVRHTPDNDPKHWQALCNEAWANAQKTQDYRALAIFGFLTENGAPAVQKAGDPLPGEAFITTTRLTLPGESARTQRAYVDAAQIPYVVLPSKFASAQAISATDGVVAAVYRPSNKALAFAVFADTGGKLDEGSIRLHQDLGSNPIVSMGGVARAKRRLEGEDVLIAVFPQVKAQPRQDADAWRNSINSLGADAFRLWGGVARLTQCSK